MLKPLFLKFSCAILFLTVTATTAFCAELTQRDWMVTLTEALGWSFGLPDEPQDPDYINILTGNREFRFEAEDIFTIEQEIPSATNEGQEDIFRLLNEQTKDNARATVMTFANFGDFSGKGWVHGDITPVTLALSFNIPIDGNYSLTARLRNLGHQFTIGNVTVAANSTQNFDNVEVGTFRFDAGPQQIMLTLPENGSIDYISLKAPNQANITPEAGWQPDKALEWDVIHTTLIQAFNLSDLFPSSNSSQRVEAENLNTQGTQVVKIQHLGKPSAGKWLKNGPLETQIPIPLHNLTNGFYDLTFRGMGQSLKVVVGSHQEFEFTTKPYLADYYIPEIYFAEGNRQLSVIMSPGSGLDYLLLKKHDVDYHTARTLFGSSSTRIPTAQDLDTLTSLLAAFGVER